MTEKKLTKKTLLKSFHHWYYGNLTCFTQEHMQTFGYLASMLPIIEELYDNKEDQKRSVNTYTAFFNTEPQIGAIVVGITAGLEEARANGSEDVDDETINGLRAGLMGPLAGIGDSLIVGTLIPVLLGIALGLSTGGSPIGAIFYIIVWNLLAYFGMRFAYFKGYELGGKAVEFLVGPQGQAIRRKVFLNLQNQLDSVYPGMLTAGVIVFCWWLMAKKKISPIKVMLLLVVIALIGVLAGFFNPGLKY